MKLYFSPGACSLAPHIALEEAGAEFELVRVDLAASEQRQPEYLGLNPKGRVPLLVTAQGSLTENPAILAYIAMTYPKANLAPVADSFAFNKMQEFNAYLSSTAHVAHAHGPRGTRWASEASSLADLKNNVPRTMTACFDLIESDYLQGPWVMGDTYSVADAYLFTIASWLGFDGVDINQYSKLAEHQRLMLERPAVQEVLAREKAGS